MEVNATYTTEDWVDAYLTIWRGMLKLTDQELEVTKLICLRYLKLTKDTSSPDILSELLLSASYRHTIREKLNLSANNLQNYLTSLKEKGVLVPYQDKFLLYDLLIPQQTITFNFLVEENQA